MVLLSLFSCCSVASNSCYPMDCSPPVFLCLWDFPGKKWSGLLLRSPRDLPDPGTEPVPPALQVDSLPLSHQGSPNDGIKKIVHRKMQYY